jgi:hypothetical protein
MARERRQTWPASITVKARVRRSANTLEAREILPGISRGGSAFGWFSQPGGASRARARYCDCNRTVCGAQRYVFPSVEFLVEEAE